MIKNAQTIAAALVAAASLAACGSGTEGKTEAAPAGKLADDVVVRIGAEVLTVDDVKAKMEEQSPFLRARFDTIERKREFLDNQIRAELMAQEAYRRGLDKDPDVQNAMKRTMVQKLTRLIEEERGQTELPESELRAFYDQNINDFVKPERVRVSHVFFAAPKGEASRNKVKAEAAKALATVRAKPEDRQVLSDLAKTRSDDDLSKRAGGDLSFKTREDLTAAWGKELADAVFNLKEVNDIGSSVVETEKGFHVIKLTGRQAAVDRPFEQVKKQIGSRLSGQARSKSFYAYIDELKEKTKIEINEDALAKIEVSGAGTRPAGLGGADRAPVIPAVKTGESAGSK